VPDAPTAMIASAAAAAEKSAWFLGIFQSTSSPCVFYIAHNIIIHTRRPSTVRGGSYTGTHPVTIFLRVCKSIVQKCIKVFPSCRRRVVSLVECLLAYDGIYL